MSDEQQRRTPDSGERVRWVYASGSNDELERRYDEWAKDYDADIEDGFGYVMPRVAAEALARFAPEGGKVLDAGAGTGLAGRELARLGFADIEAMDMSQGMLEQAQAKGVYAKLHRMVMGEPLGFETGYFDAVICVGALTLGHAPASSLDELARVVKPGGCVAFTMRPDVYERNGFREKQARLEADGAWELVSRGDEFQGLPKGEPDVLFRVWVYRVC